MWKTTFTVALLATTTTAIGQDIRLDPKRPGVAVLTGAPVRPLTDPRGLVSLAKPDATPVPIADLFFTRSSWFASWTPDGQVVMATDLTGRTNLWRVPKGGGFPLQLQQSEDKTFYPQPTPDGKFVLYASDVGGREIFDIWSIPAAGGAAVNLTATPDASDTGPFAITRDSRMIAFNRRVATEPSTNVAVMSLADRKVRVLSHETEAGTYWFARAFDSTGRYLYADRTDAAMTGSSVWRFDVATGASVKIAGDERHVFESLSALSPDDRTLSLTSQNAAGQRQAVLLNIADGTRTLIRPSPWPQTAGAFSPDGRTALAISNVDGRDEVYRYDLASKAVSRLPLLEGKVSDFSGTLPAFSPDGAQLLFPHSSGSAPFDYWTYDVAGGTPKRLTQLGLASIDPAALPKSSVVSYKSADGTVISAILWMPWNLKRDGSAPVVVLAHGGPTGQTFDDFDRTAIALASRGYMVIAPNVRGSTGYGATFEAANRGDLGGRDLEDEAWGAKFLVASGYADPKKIGITGGSYGGFMTVMAVARMPDFWAAGVEEYGIVNWNTMWERGSPALREYQRGLIGDPAKDKDVYRRVSPLTYLRDTKAPLLVLQGANDIRVPAHEAEQIADVLKAAGKTVDSKVYAEEGHGFLKRENQIDAAERTVAWFDTYLKGRTDAR
ncbi:S9 family peptidase [Sphingomonas sp. RB3P16]|uniref:S9 family peptidase n=1 Tax=Parasphingomonas frigoris TaxID=3096163 RepID=UPI002FC9F574